MNSCSILHNGLMMAVKTGRRLELILCILLEPLLLGSLFLYLLTDTFNISICNADIRYVFLLTVLSVHGWPRIIRLQANNRWDYRVWIIGHQVIGHQGIGHQVIGHQVIGHTVAIDCQILNFKNFSCLYFDAREVFSTISKHLLHHTYYLSIVHI